MIDRLKIVVAKYCKYYDKAYIVFFPTEHIIQFRILHLTEEICRDIPWTLLTLQIITVYLSTCAFHILYSIH